MYPRMTAAAPDLGVRSFRQPRFEDYLPGRIREQEPGPEVEGDGGTGKHCQEQEDDSGEGWTDAQLGGKTMHTPTTQRLEPRRRLVPRMMPKNFSMQIVCCARS